MQTWHELQRRIERARLNGRLQDKYETRLQEAKRERQRCKAELERLEKWWREEEQDVERLRSWSMANFFFTLFGQKERKLEREEEEALRAKEQYELAQDAYSQAEADETEWRCQLIGVSGADEELQRAIEEKERLPRACDRAVAGELDAIISGRAWLQTEKRELDEAIQAGREALHALKRAEEQFRSARNWGRYDMLGGGTIVTYLKHNRYDDAKAELHNANHRLRRFGRELEDVKKLRQTAQAVDIGAGLTFADYVFDGFLTDWMVQGRINRSLERVEEAIRHVQATLRRLEQEVVSVERRQADSEREYATLIENWFPANQS
ncbi:hypothetical protein L5D93_13645 [Paenibacillus thiaminolyticus]|nr:hypothetical protein [Paenibacillus thiaminolyticus]